MSHYSPGWICDVEDAHQGGEPGGQDVTTDGSSRIHGGYELDSLETEPLAVLVVKPVVRDQLCVK